MVRESDSSVTWSTRRAVAADWSSSLVFRFSVDLCRAAWVLVLVCDVEEVVAIAINWPVGVNLDEWTHEEVDGVSLLSSLLGPYTSHTNGSEVVLIFVHLKLDSSSRLNLIQPAKISLMADMLNEGLILIGFSYYRSHFEDGAKIDLFDMKTVYNNWYEDLMKTVKIVPSATRKSLSTDDYEIRYE
ncbi:hypothetical protein L6452_42132 [Arctium lappa]|uniref:Uncharacterized protein n=1 Tax=Arctium lappa TaxID=4217 RepID=A0ACB8XHZ9_ARCLA|nr:hypothetical protein L6452_42132 [Arctium lappa]